ncbi:MAG TPA: hypothetical protein VEZ12_02390, partial [Herpetosiphonaceae bacterium]|nr:hypothetical protein [Herpetosiphonaceae bacterium]
RRVVLLTDEGNIPISNFGATDTSRHEEEINRFVREGGRRSLTVRHTFNGARLGNIAGSCLVLPMLIGISTALLGYLRRRSPVRRQPRSRRSSGDS